MAERKGLVHVYTGDGKGKTTAALGLALRAAGHGMRTYIAQFLKGQDYGELHALERLSPWVVIEQFGRPGFVHVKGVTPEDRAMAVRGLTCAREAMGSGAYDLVILDEINVALYFGLIELEEVLALLEDRPEHVELVLTGRGAPEELLERADYVTEMREVRHPYQRGILARKGIEF